MTIDPVTSHTVEPVVRPPTPVNVSARWLANGEVLISWTPATSSAVQSTLQYTVEYRTVGQWVPLIDHLENTSYTWKTASRGVVYHFRVRSSQLLQEAGSKSVRSRPSSEISLLPEGLS